MGELALISGALLGARGGAGASITGVVSDVSPMCLFCLFVFSSSFIMAQIWSSSIATDESLLHLDKCEWDRPGNGIVRLPGL
mmetsp:Transcript_34456/g.101260  ORF Transcript_34456/g.101260 Transcript_34456/m.101260 type:complete len:82 (+) Transcript_34456:615-860(+)